MMLWNHRGWDAGDWLTMSFMMIVFWGLVIALVIWLVRSLRSDRGREHVRTSTLTWRAEDVLAERMARGEIDEAEFTRSLDALHTTTGRP